MKKIKKLLWKLAIKIIAKRIVFSQNYLTPKYLESKGWEKHPSGFYIEPYIKDRDRISIKFDEDCKVYTVWHSSANTFITCEKSLEWFELYYLLAHPDNGINKLAGL